MPCNQIVLVAVELLLYSVVYNKHSIAVFLLANKGLLHAAKESYCRNGYGKEDVLPDHDCMHHPAVMTAVFLSFYRKMAVGNRYTDQTALCSCSK